MICIGMQSLPGLIRQDDAREKSNNRRPGLLKNRIGRSVELLAPAGRMDELKAAVSAGADAVYLGGRLFNARMNAGNFGDEEMEQAVAYAHLRGVKIYVTMNTLLYDDELEEALRYAAFLYNAGVDALIIQDLGLGSLVRKYIPGFEIHLSTQGTVYNASGARMALSLGYSRVVAAREMSLEEIKDLAAECETEVFVHGAICMCYSGQCQLSRYIGGRSGNRGQCAQPCRLLYEDEKGRKGYWLSPKDLCLIDRLGDLIDAGACSFKIEGRMKSPEYVATVTRIYRKYIDAYIKQGSYTVTREDRMALMQIFSRGSFTEGYISGQPASFLSGDLPKHQGVLIGHVLGKGHHDLVRVQLNDGLEMGDGVEIRGGAPGERRPSGNVVTYIEALGHGKNSKNGEFMIGDIRGDVRPVDMVYRISSKRQLDEARQVAEGDLKKIQVQMKFFAVPGKRAQLTVRCEGADDGRKISISVESEGSIEQASNRPAGEEFVRDKLAKTGDTVYAAKRIDVRLAGDCYLPASVINQMRRSALEMLDEERLDMKRELAELPEELGALLPELPDLPELQKLPEMPEMPNLLEQPEELSGGNSPEESERLREEGRGAVVFPEITKGDLDKEIEEKINEGAYDGQTVMVNNLGWITELQQHGAMVYGGKGLNVMNGAAAEVLKEAGVTVAEISKELEPVPGRLMISEFDIQQKELKDSKNNRFSVVKEHGKSVVIADVSTT